MVEPYHDFHCRVGGISLVDSSDPNVKRRVALFEISFLIMLDVPRSHKSWFVINTLGKPSCPFSIPVPVVPTSDIGRIGLDIVPTTRVGNPLEVISVLSYALPTIPRCCIFTPFVIESIYMVSHVNNAPIVTSLSVPVV